MDDERYHAKERESFKLLRFYNSWRKEFEVIKAELAHDLGNGAYLEIEHIGSTSVPDLWSKDVIDIHIVIHPSKFSHLGLQQMKGALKYSPGNSGDYVLQPLQCVKDRWSFKCLIKDGEGNEIKPERHVYVVAKGSIPWRNCRDVRKTLREDAELKKEYGDTKKELAREFDTVEYGPQKNTIIRKILRKAGWTEEEIDEKEAGFTGKRDEDVYPEW